MLAELSLHRESQGALEKAMRARQFVLIAGIFSLISLLAGCGGSSSSSTPPPTSSNAELSWQGSSNGTYVMDANGISYYFSAKTGCMFSKSNNSGPANFCLTPTTAQTSGYAYYGATGCTNPTNNSACDSGSFAVVLTNNPLGTGCIAVLSSGTATSATGEALAVTSVTGGFDVLTSTTASAFTAYWNGMVPICGGSSPYVGTYTGTAPASSTYCHIVEGQFSGPTTACTVNFTIDSGGVINAQKPANGLGGISGSITANGTGQYVSFWTTTNLGTQQSNDTISSATKNSNGKWVLAVTGDGSYSMTQQ